MLSHIKALVGHVNDNGVLRESVLFQIVQHAADVPVERSGRAQVIAHVTLVLPFSQGLSVQVAGFQVLLDGVIIRSEEHTSELQSLMRISYAVFCLKKKTNNTHTIIQ